MLRSETTTSCFRDVALVARLVDVDAGRELALASERSRSYSRFS